MIQSKCNSTMSEQIESEQYQSWIGNTETSSDLLTTAPMVSMAATLDKADLNFDIGTEVPPLWHWLFFLNPARHSLLASDGHAEKGDFLPPIPLPRRMWAGSRFEFRQPLLVGETISRRSEIKSIKFKQGRSGQLAFVCVHHQVSSERGIALREEHDIVFRDNAAAATPAPEPLSAPEQSDFHRSVTADAVLLFRYSALTFNGHRIHYDRDYVTQTEGYPGLVVHGPLLATLLCDLLLESLPGCKLEKFEFKAMHPVFDLNDFKVCGLQPDEHNVSRLWIQDHNGSLCMDAAATVTMPAQ